MVAALRDAAHAENSDEWHGFHNDVDDLEAGRKAILEHLRSTNLPRLPLWWTVVDPSEEVPDDRLSLFVGEPLEVRRNRVRQDPPRHRCG